VQEDIELAYRLDALGLKIRYNARAVTRHHHPMTVDSFAWGERFRFLARPRIFRKLMQEHDLRGLREAGSARPEVRSSAMLQGKPGEGPPRE